jgi:hypothetical protein
MGKGGRSTKLTEELIAELERTAAAHWSINDACAHLGITDKTWRNWKAVGEKEHEAGERDSIHVRFLLLATRVGAPRRRTICAGVLQTIALDKEAKASDRVAAALGLLRLDAASKVEVSGPDGGALQIAARSWADDIRALIERQAIEQGIDPPPAEDD